MASGSGWGGNYNRSARARRERYAKAEGKYSNTPLSSLEQIRDRQREIMRRNNLARSLDPNSSSAAVRRRQAAAARAYNTAAAEYDEINRAIERARRRGRYEEVPF